jgi:hypothetical protein
LCWKASYRVNALCPIFFAGGEIVKKTTYIKAIIVLMALLMISRVRTFIVQGGFDTQSTIFTIIEGLFLIWGIVVLKKDI